VGPNGSGKTFVLKIIWMLSFLAFIEVNGKSKNLDAIKFAQKTLESTFDDVKQFHGTFVAEFERATVDLNIDKGKVFSCLINLNKGVTKAAVPIFMSKNLRTFDQLEQMLKLKKKIGEENIEEFYKIYDLVYAVKITDILSKGFEVTKEFNESLDAFGLKDRFKKFILIGDTQLSYVDHNDCIRSLTTLSAGEQSLLNMFITTMG
jgi:predicted ATP-binding protein involved in virulence